MSFSEEDIKYLVIFTGGKKYKTINELDSNETSTTETDSDCEYTTLLLPTFDLSTKKSFWQREKNSIHHSIRGQV